MVWLVSKVSVQNIFLATDMYPQDADPHPPSSTRGKADKNHLNKKITPLPRGIGERYSQTTSKLGHAVLLRRCEFPLYTKVRNYSNSGGPLFNSVLWDCTEWKETFSIATPITPPLYLNMVQSSPPIYARCGAPAAREIYALNPLCTLGGPGTARIHITCTTYVLSHGPGHFQGSPRTGRKELVSSGTVRNKVYALCLCSTYGPRKKT
jgi:hypothetical protein